MAPATFLTRLVCFRLAVTVPLRKPFEIVGRSSGTPRLSKALVECLPVLHRNMIQSTAGHLRELEERFRELATERVAPRVARQLLRLQEQAGSPQNHDAAIGLSREGLAQMTGTTIYAVSRLLSAWEAGGLVSSSRGFVTVSNVSSLRRVFEDN